MNCNLKSKKMSYCKWWASLPSTWTTKSILTVTKPPIKSTIANWPSSPSCSCFLRNWRITTLTYRLNPSMLTNSPSQLLVTRSKSINWVNFRALNLIKWKNSKLWNRVNLRDVRKHKCGFSNQTIINHWHSIWDCQTRLNPGKKCYGTLLKLLMSLMNSKPPKSKDHKEWKQVTSISNRVIKSSNSN